MTTTVEVKSEGQSTVQRLCVACKERFDSLGLKAGKRTDERAIEFFAGALAGLRMSEKAMDEQPTEAEFKALQMNDTLDMWIRLALCTRGYAEVERVVNELRQKNFAASEAQARERIERTRRAKLAASRQRFADHY